MLMVKNAKQLRLGDVVFVFLQTFLATQKVKQCNSFASSYSNKHELIRLFVIKQKAKTTQRTDNKVFYIAVGVFVRFLAEKFTEENVLLSNQERLDTRMLPDLKYIIALILACYSVVQPTCKRLVEKYIFRLMLGILKVQSVYIFRKQCGLK